MATAYALGGEGTGPERSSDNQVDFAIPRADRSGSASALPFRAATPMKSTAKTPPPSPPSPVKSARSPSRPLPPATIFLNIPAGSPPDHRLPANQPARGIFYS